MLVSGKFFGEGFHTRQSVFNAALNCAFISVALYRDININADIRRARRWRLQSWERLIIGRESWRRLIGERKIYRRPSRIIGWESRRRLIRKGKIYRRPSRNINRRERKGKFIGVRLGIGILIGGLGLSVGKVGGVW